MYAAHHICQGLCFIDMRLRLDGYGKWQMQTLVLVHGLPLYLREEQLIRFTAKNSIEVATSQDKCVSHF